MTELDDILGLNDKLKKEHCPYGNPPAIEIESESEWTINGISRNKADPALCQIIIASSDACVGCPLNVPKKTPSDYLNYIVELDEVLSAGCQLELTWGEWRCRALLQRKRNEVEIKRMKEKK